MTQVAKVFHAGTPIAPKGETATFTQLLLDGKRYTLVATVEIPDGMPDADAREYAFERTNSIDRPWWQNRGVVLGSGLTGARSTSVGDIVVLDGGAFRVEGAGWSKVTT